MQRSEAIEALIVHLMDSTRMSREDAAAQVAEVTADETDAQVFARVPNAVSAADLGMDPASQRAIAAQYRHTLGDARNVFAALASVLALAGDVDDPFSMPEWEGEGRGDALDLMMLTEAEEELAYDAADLYQVIQLHTVIGYILRFHGTEEHYGQIRWVALNT